MRSRAAWWVWRNELILVHQEADGAAVHAVDRDAGAHVAVQGLQHQAVAAERDDDVGVFRRMVAVHGHELRKRLLGLRTGAGHEGNARVFA